MLDLTDYTYRDILSQNDRVIVYCWADWCSPCKVFAPTYKEAEQENAGVIFTKVNVDEQVDLARRLNVKAVPTILFYYKNQLRDTIIGTTTKEDIKNRVQRIYV